MFISRFKMKTKMSKHNKRNVFEESKEKKTVLNLMLKVNLIFQDYIK